MIGSTSTALEFLRLSPTLWPCVSGSDTGISGWMPVVSCKIILMIRFCSLMLCGIYIAMRFLQSLPLKEITQTPGQVLTERSDIWASFTHSLSKTVWDTRGWTFQENFLSRRLLLFSPDAPFFVCETRVYSEQGFQQLDPDSIHHDCPGSFFNIKSRTQMEVYLAAVQHYSKRELTMEADFENAMKGIAKVFRHTMDGRPNGFFQGIPTSLFDEIFCWRVAEHNPEVRRLGFPSWNWQGWKQTPIFPKFIVDRINSIRRTNRWGSLILADDRGKIELRTKLSLIGRNTSNTRTLMIS